MKKLKVLAASVALALGATNASAAITLSTATTGSSLFLVVWNSSTAYIRDLGVTMNALLNNSDPNAATGLNSAWTTAGSTIDKTTSGYGSFAAGSNWGSSGLVPQGPSTQFMIYAAESNTPSGTSYFRTSDPSATPGSQTNNIVQAATQAIGQAIASYNLAGNFSPAFAGSASCSVGSDCYVASTASGAYPDGTPFGENTVANNSGGSDGLTFWWSKAANGLGSGSTTPVQFGELGNAAANPGKWYLESDGDVRYEIAGSPVPVPGALWLLGSGLLGLVGVSRRRKTSPLQKLAIA
jgi:hypothetical protein